MAAISASTLADSTTPAACNCSRRFTIAGGIGASAGGLAAFEAFFSGMPAEAEVRQELRTEAAQRVRRSLVLGKLAEAEGIEVTEEEVQAEVDRQRQGAQSARKDCEGQDKVAADPDCGA